MTQTMRQARERYFADNKFGADGGYEAAWVDFKLGKLPMPFPNTPARVRAVRFHDLHHLITGYRTDLVGEFEISGWEVGAGCHTFAAAWFLNLSGLAGGLFLCPRKVYRAFRRGLASSTLYPLEFEPLLERTVDELRAQTGVDVEVPPPSVVNGALFAFAAVTGLTLATVTMLFALSPVALIAWIVTYRRWATSVAGR